MIHMPAAAHGTRIDQAHPGVQGFVAGGIDVDAMIFNNVNPFGSERLMGPGAGKNKMHRYLLLAGIRGNTARISLRPALTPP